MRGLHRGNHTPSDKTLSLSALDGGVIQGYRHNFYGMRTAGLLFSIAMHANEEKAGQRRETVVAGPHTLGRGAGGGGVAVLERTKLLAYQGRVR